MKSKSCSLGPEQRLHRRLHYCGSCKTMGRLFQRSRVFLNNDAVFSANYSRIYPAPVMVKNGYNRTDLMTAFHFLTMPRQEQVTRIVAGVDDEQAALEV